MGYENVSNSKTDILSNTLVGRLFFATNVVC